MERHGAPSVRGVCSGFFSGDNFLGRSVTVRLPRKSPRWACIFLLRTSAKHYSAVRKPGMGHLGCKTRSRLALTQAVVVFAEISDTPPESLPIPVPFHRNDKMQ